MTCNPPVAPKHRHGPSTKRVSGPRSRDTPSPGQPTGGKPSADDSPAFLSDVCADRCGTGRAEKAASGPRTGHHCPADSTSDLQSHDGAYRACHADISRDLVLTSRNISEHCLAMGNGINSFVVHRFLLKGGGGV
uniref:Uncharacterized protein n=1 Tax=Branchiostoma floridae TaxID=7739 RepID=C3YRH4_BRAFL|eukprot:XP_002601159.1 hypothetical protein BRAFLDRAFT_75608 [Branchiostoma floridae]